MIEADLDTLSPTQRRAAELLVADVRRLRLLVDDLLEISRFDAGAEQLELERVDISRLVIGVTAARLPRATVAVPRLPVTVATESRRIDRIMGNLLDNAREHAPGASVEVGRGPDPAGVVVDRSPTGDPGVPDDVLPHLFERFYKADPSRTSAGSGLGLAIAAEHAALLGGTLRARSRPGGGLVVAFTLPVTRSLPVGDGVDTRGSDGSEHSRTPNEGTAMSHRHAFSIVTTVLFLAIASTACAPGAGSLGTPATPRSDRLGTGWSGVIGRRAAEPDSGTHPCHLRVAVAIGPGGHGSPSPSAPATPTPTSTPAPTPVTTTTLRAYFLIGQSGWQPRVSSRCCARSPRRRPWPLPRCRRCCQGRTPRRRAPASAVHGHPRTGHDCSA